MQTTSSLDRASSRSRACAHTRNAVRRRNAERPRSGGVLEPSPSARALNRVTTAIDYLARRAPLAAAPPPAAAAAAPTRARQPSLQHGCRARRNAAQRGGRRPRLPPAAVPNTDSAAARMPAQAISTAPPQPAWIRLHGDTSPELDYRHHAIVTWALLDKGQSVAQQSQFY
jgi:hypothetical protein